MADQIEVNGMIISSRPQGENDKRVVILTKELGRITAFARGARRQGNHLMAASDSFAMGSFSLIRGRDSYTMVSAQIKEYFRELLGDLQNTYLAYYLLELAEYYAVENQDGGPMLNLIYLSFRALLDGKHNPALVRRCYELKLMVLNGEYPDFFHCVMTGHSEHLVGFSMSRHGVVSDEAKNLVSDCLPLSSTTLFTLQYIVRTPITKLYAFDVKEESLKELRMVCDRCLHAYVDRPMKALDILDSLCI